MIAHESAHLSEDNKVKIRNHISGKADIDSEFLVYAKKAWK